jgi:hypothetical protein
MTEYVVYDDVSDTLSMIIVTLQLNMILRLVLYCLSHLILIYHLAYLDNYILDQMLSLR